MTFEKELGVSAYDTTLLLCQELLGICHVAEIEEAFIIFRSRPGRQMKVHQPPEDAEGVYQLVP
jgi:hypothetical protein